MNKKIEDAAKEYADKETPENAYYDLYNEVITERHDNDCLYTWSREDKSFAFRAGAEFALREAIEIIENAKDVVKDQEPDKYTQGMIGSLSLIQLNIEQLLRTEEK